MNEIIKIKNLEKKYDEKQVLDNITCSISEGEIFGLLGPSGVGKTTIINILTGQAKKTSGEVTVLGINTDNLKSDDYAMFGMVFDALGLFEQLTCYQNMEIYADIHNVNKKEIPILLEQVNLLKDAKTKAYKLSRGMRQRLALARAVMHKPKILFLDEPTSALDPANALEIHKMILGLREQGTTIFLTTHRMEEAMKLCDNIALLYKGDIKEYGPPDEICRKYNIAKNITLTFKDGSKIVIPDNDEAPEIVAQYMKSGNVEGIHSSEPNLEEVFLSVTSENMRNEI